MEREGRVGTSDGNRKRVERGEGQTSKKAYAVTQQFICFTPQSNNQHKKNLHHRHFRNNRSVVLTLLQRKVYCHLWPQGALQDLEQ